MSDRGAYRDASGIGTFAPSPYVRALHIGDQTALFCERTQRLSELNETASLLWRELAGGTPLPTIVNRLTELGLARAPAEALIKPQLEQWLRLGYLTPLAVIAALSGPPSGHMFLSLGDFGAELSFFGDADAGAAAAAFAALQSDGVGFEAPVRIAIVAHHDGQGEGDYVFVSQAPIGCAPARQTIPRLKALLTELYCSHGREGFVAHGALVSLADKRIFLGGEPGAGKTTLTLALVGEGFAYGGDDIVEISADGAVRGVPFAAAAKSGAWDLLGDYVPGLDRLAIHEREDGKLVRYVAPTVLDDGEPRPIDLYLILRREPGAAAQFDPLSRLEALCALLDSGFSKRGAIKAASLEALANAFASARCARLLYDDLPGAIAAIKSHLRE